jgi:hypothetical protein
MISGCTFLIALPFCDDTKSVQQAAGAKPTRTLEFDQAAGFVIVTDTEKKKKWRVPLRHVAYMTEDIT